MSDEWSGGDAVAVTRKNSYTGLVYYNNITSPSYSENTVSYYAKLTFGD